jgi:hypothetical protein
MCRIFLFQVKLDFRDSLVGELEVILRIMLLMWLSRESFCACAATYAIADTAYGIYSRAAIPGFEFAALRDTGRAGPT